VIGRLWRGWATAEGALEYTAHLRDSTFPALARMGGFERAYALRRKTDEGVEFVVLTLWESLAAVRGFAGADYEAAVVPPEARHMLTTFDDRVSHFELAVEGVKP
jgi:hypothetical protein